MNLLNLKKINLLFIFIIIILALIGTAALYSAGEAEFDLWAKKHIIRFFVFLIIIFLIASIDIKIFYKYAYFLFFMSLLLLLSVEIIGTLGKGAERWINIFGFSVQPSELIKVFIVLALAKFYHDLRFDKIGKITNMIIPIIILSIPSYFIIAQPDLGTAATVILLGILIIFYDISMILI